MIPAFEREMRELEEMQRRRIFASEICMTIIIEFGKYVASERLRQNNPHALTFQGEQLLWRIKAASRASRMYLSNSQHQGMRINDLRDFLKTSIRKAVVAQLAFEGKPQREQSTQRDRFSKFQPTSLETNQSREAVGFDLIN